MADYIAYSDVGGLIVKLDRQGPIELDELATSLSALSKLCARHCGEPLDAADATSPRLYVISLKTGSLIAHLAPLVPVLGQVVEVMNTMVVVRDFTKMLGDQIEAFADQTDPQDKQKSRSRDDIKDLREFLKPVAAQTNAKLNLKAVKYKQKKSNGEEISVEYTFDSQQINRAVLSMDRDLEFSLQAPAASKGDRHTTVREKLMIFDQASRKIPKGKGRTGDRVVIQEITDKPVNVYFPEGAADIKRTILEGTENPFSKGYIVDVVVQYVGEEPKVYKIMKLHEVVNLGD